MPSAKKTAHLYDFQDEVYDHLSVANMWLNHKERGGQSPEELSHRSQLTNLGIGQGGQGVVCQNFMAQQEEHVVCWPFDLTWEYVESFKIGCITALDQFRFFCSLQMLRRTLVNLGERFLRSFKF